MRLSFRHPLLVCSGHVESTGVEVGGIDGHYRGDRDEVDKPVSKRHILWLEI